MAYDWRYLRAFRSNLGKLFDDDLPVSVARLRVILRHPFASWCSLSISAKPSNSLDRLRRTIPFFRAVVRAAAAPAASPVDHGHPGQL